mmetsp:Transcript_73711/g.130129  ORF Transcript_73711/g.130129 Transcript_73711/m.130129 type:complete len:356 (-) Transcript_73711:97-1164(-)|eukprot:CAMPEP_0197681860 /NCGR_PEP_ID=MMETSP1338-20131121/95582_1 /TAXON_ID=43686 ORGANISM="Pelagodinium beii, Strain RCC1491" /NCGR_SAMPLE_ID=MMETSP1338 /ASSEMBLY_ACC=CAM_ASM_000754 /LENGTH=355 /DNA_ID=CAMNT_0043263257 /DNA_START=49 /DNA_END=1116 /DNA_ORIENTATION=-
MAAALGREAAAHRRHFFTPQHRRQHWLSAVEGPDGPDPEPELFSSISGPGAGGHGIIAYPPKFLLYSFFVLLACASWITNYQRLLVPTIWQSGEDTLCTSLGGSSLPQSARMLCIYFIWFVLVRAALFTPCVVRRVSAGVVDSSGAVNHRYIPHALLRDMPLYLFIVGSLLFVYYLMQSENCHTSKELFDVLRLYASSNCFLSPIIGFFAAWHNTILFAVATRRGVMSIDDGATSGSLAVSLSALETVQYHTDDFGDEAGKLYPSSCAICLASWEDEDLIIVTPCRHVFHKDCLKTWFRCSHTCAMCRYDLSRQTAASQHENFQAQALGRSSARLSRSREQPTVSPERLENQSQV